MRNTSTGGFLIYDISNNQITSYLPHGRGRIGLAVRGLRPHAWSRYERPGFAGRQHRRIRSYDIANNQLTGAASLGQVGLDWQLRALRLFRDRVDERRSGAPHRSSCRRWLALAAARCSRQLEYRPRRCRHVTADVADDAAAFMRSRRSTLTLPLHRGIQSRLMSLVGHSRPRRSKPREHVCPLLPEKQTSSRSSRYVRLVR